MRKLPPTAETAFIPTKTMITAQQHPPINCLGRGKFSGIWLGSCGFALAVLSFSLLSCRKAEAFSFNFTKIADTNTPVPGAETGNFISFNTLPSLDNGNVGRRLTNNQLAHPSTNRLVTPTDNESTRVG